MLEARHPNIIWEAISGMVTKERKLSGTQNSDTLTQEVKTFRLRRPGTQEQNRGRVTDLL